MPPSNPPSRAPADTVATSLRQVRRTLDDADSSLVGRRVLAMCSGGADSVALVSLLSQLPRGAAPRQIDVLWLDHALRDGADASREHAAAQAVADQAGATLHVRRCHVDLADDDAGIEAAARAWRYDAALSAARELECHVVCTGHTASDQLEQALLALVGVTGSAGDVDAMRVARPLDASIALVRPMLTLTRADVERWCRDHGLAWAEDPSNADPDAHERNAIRHRVVPPLLAVKPDAGIGIVRAAQRRRETLDTTRALARALLDAWDDDGRLDVRALATLPIEARRELLAAWLDRHAADRSIGTRIVHATERLATGPARAACAAVDLPGSACVRRDGYHLCIQHETTRGGSRP
jgi:tRNA(Ile)-lysidine synthase